MELKDNTILITGGATGIGFALAKRFIALDNTVIICGRREEKLEAAKNALHDLHTICADISKADDRKMLRERIDADFGGINVLVNNAGIQRAIDLKNGIDGLTDADEEIEINFKSQVYMSLEFIPSLLKKKSAAIINVSSGLGFAPLANFPIYSATKAGVHSFTMSLRAQLMSTPIRVFEVIPPAVHDTELKGEPVEKTEWSIFAAEMANAVMDGLKAGKHEIAAGTALNLLSASKSELDESFRRMNGMAQSPS